MSEAYVIVTMRIMPTSPEVDWESKKEEVRKIIEELIETNTEFKFEIKPIAFGLKALEVRFAMKESKGDTEFIEKKLNELDFVESAETIQVSRALG